MRLDYQSSESLAPVIEALLFASDEPLPAQTLRALILGEEALAPQSNGHSESGNGNSATADIDLDATSISLTDDFPVTSDASEDFPADDAEANPARAEKKRKRKQLLELPVVHSAIEALNAFYEEQSRAYRIVEIAGGYQFATRSEFGEYVARLFKEKSRRRLSGAALESLAIIAYKQPVSKNDIENIRGVNCDEVLKSLLEKNLITITGRAESVGRPLLYGTTVDFLRHFGLPSIADLPRPREIDELMKEESVRATTLEEAANEFVSPEFAASANDMTVDEAISVARNWAEREEAQEEALEEAGIGLDLAAMEQMSPGHSTLDEEQNN
jgi:segregation and condensation protein B